MPEIYQYVDENMKRDENILTVDFYFDSDISKEEAVDEVDRDFCIILSHTSIIAFIGLGLVT